MAPASTRGLTTAVSAVTVIALFFAYSRSATQAAKRDAVRHRVADGGQISWRNENQRRHGLLSRPESPNALGALFTSSKQDEKIEAQTSKTTEEETLQAAKGRVRRWKDEETERTGKGQA
ncbi:MAG: hypothetical protein LQ346_000100 [Caloplaca aetnensis]|nr:MAG: hypothetical protein LQ346_000100 [Caloplaca aetnensis]